MGCGCGGAPSGYERKFQVILNGKPVAEYDSENDARLHLAKTGGRVQRVTKRVTA